MTTEAMDAVKSVPIISHKMPIKKSQLYSSIWQGCDELRGGMDASQYKDYVLVLLFVRYVSDKYADQKNALVIIPEGGSFADLIKLKGKPNIGEGINTVLDALAEANGLKGVINNVDFNDEDKLGRGKEMQDRLSNLVAIFENPELDFSKNRAEGDDLLGDAYEYLMKHFAVQSGKSKGQFYTPAEVSRIIAKVIGADKAAGRTQTVREEYKKVVVDPVRLEFFKGSARTVSIPAATGRIFPGGTESTLLMMPVALALDPSSYYIVLTARSDDPGVGRAQRICEDAIDREITNLSLIFTPYIFDRLLYRGSIIEGNVISYAGYVRRERPIHLDPAHLEAEIKAMRRAHISSDPDLQRRRELMARFFSKAVALDPSEEKFLFLWTALEVFPMKDTTNIGPISDYLGQILNRPAAEVKDKLGIGRTFGLRSDLVHNGRLDLTPEQLAELIQKLENICLEVFRSISGQPYGKLLDRYFT
jgi:hypothetical protein